MTDHVFPVQATVQVLYDVAAERDRQDKKWGVQLHDPQWWLVILAEEVGEVARAIFEADDAGVREDYRAELVQVAAVAVAAIESLDAQESR